MDKIFITASDLLQDSFRLAARIHRSGFRPDFIIGIWRGGTPVGIGERARTIRVHGLHYIIDEADADDSLLVVDDVFDSGHSIEALLAELGAKMRLNMPRQVRIATPWYKPGNNRTSLVPHYYLHETDAWLVFPHELAGLTYDEIKAGKRELAPVVDLLRPTEA
jgi:hypoxanthine phosphoribosyltransferase